MSDSFVTSKDYRLLFPWDFPGKNTGVDCHFLHQGNLSDPGIEPVSPALAGGVFIAKTPREPKFKLHLILS